MKCATNPSSGVKGIMSSSREDMLRRVSIVDVDRNATQFCKHSAKPSHCVQVAYSVSSAMKHNKARTTAVTDSARLVQSGSDMATVLDRNVEVRL